MRVIEELLSATLREPLRDAAAGGALGYVGLDIPPDLLLAGNRVSCHLPLRDARETTATSRWLESSFPAWAHSILQGWSEGEFDCFEQVIFSRGEDVTHRLYYYICELRRQGRIGGPQPLVFDIARIPRESSRRFTADSLRSLAQQLGIDEAAWRAGVLRANARRKLFAAIRAQRRGPGSFYERLMRASLYCDPVKLLSGWHAESVTDESSVRGVVLAGSVPPDDRLHRWVEKAGWNIVEELHDRGLRRLGGEVEAAASDLPRAVADSWLMQHFTARDGADPTQKLLEAVTETRAAAVILWCTREDEALAWRVPAQRTALSRAGIPALVLVARAWSLDDGAEQEIRTFLQGIPDAAA